MDELFLKNLLTRLEKGNPFGEKVTLVAATKTRSPQEINRALALGVTDIGENKVQEMREKYPLVCGGVRHFIGHLQRNKVKYLIGKVDLIQSVDRDELAQEIALLSCRAGIVTDILVQINIGEETTKSGYPLSEGLPALKRLSAMEGIRIKGFMAMLPDTPDRGVLTPLAMHMRALFEEGKRRFPQLGYLSMGMSGDWELCVEHGSNMIRLGTAIFGQRPAAPTV